MEWSAVTIIKLDGAGREEAEAERRIKVPGRLGTCVRFGQLQLRLHLINLNIGFDLSFRASSQRGQRSAQQQPATSNHLMSTLSDADELSNQAAALDNADFFWLCEIVQILDLSVSPRLATGSSVFPRTKNKQKRSCSALHMLYFLCTTGKPQTLPHVLPWIPMLLGLSWPSSREKLGISLLVS
ncbi:hypothetical protein TEQG_05449 [Trichophyton equinum CBS 127.97]|uniref:Uncharacterized protein n=1 Tax=Trichophyton equinum (strain ATCC MYA-4606 / CBS 127.97) TaxID=559882 RepID=F2PX29_TRIEC|nr:hypothetical protein TEQG_05449 [Trichophyton equinum CBS 127.97]